MKGLLGWKGAVDEIASCVKERGVARDIRQAFAGQYVCLILNEEYLLDYRAQNAEAPGSRMDWMSALQDPLSKT